MICEELLLSFGMEVPFVWSQRKRFRITSPMTSGSNMPLDSVHEFKGA